MYHGNVIPEDVLEGAMSLGQTSFRLKEGVVLRMFQRRKLYICHRTHSKKMKSDGVPPVFSRNFMELCSVSALTGEVKLADRHLSFLSLCYTAWRKK